MNTYVEVEGRVIDVQITKEEGIFWATSMIDSHEIKTYDYTEESVLNIHKAKMKQELVFRL